MIRNLDTGEWHCNIGERVWAKDSSGLIVPYIALKDDSGERCLRCDHCFEEDNYNCEGLRFVLDWEGINQLNEEAFYDED